MREPKLMLWKKISSSNLKNNCFASWAWIFASFPSLPFEVAPNLYRDLKKDLLFGPSCFPCLWKTMKTIWRSLTFSRDGYCVCWHAWSVLGLNRGRGPCFPLAGEFCKFYANTGGKRPIQRQAFLVQYCTVQAASQSSTFVNAQLYSTCD